MEILKLEKENFDPEILSYIGNLHICNLEIVMTSKVLLEREGMLVGLAMEEFGYEDFEATVTSLGKFKPWVFLREVFLKGLNSLSLFKPIKP
jgi:hypothetical protein